MDLNLYLCASKVHDIFLRNLVFHSCILYYGRYEWKKYVICLINDLSVSITIYSQKIDDVVRVIDDIYVLDYS